MSNGTACCILGLCCPPGSARQVDALISTITNHYRECDHATAEAAAKAILEKTDCFRGVAAIVSETVASKERK